jgi:hypothetical protein
MSFKNEIHALEINKMVVKINKRKTTKPGMQNSYVTLTGVTR